MPASTSFQWIMWRSSVDEREPILTSPENIEALAAFHRSILDNRSRFEQAEGKLYTSSLRIQYDTPGLFDMSRQYTIDYLFWAESPEMKRILSLRNTSPKLILQCKGGFLYRATYTDRPENNYDISEPDLVEELVACMEKDFRQSFEEYISLRPSYVNIEIQYIYTAEGVVGGKGETGYMTFHVPLNAENTINGLRPMATI